MAEQCSATSSRAAICLYFRGTTPQITAAGIKLHEDQYYDNVGDEKETSQIKVVTHPSIVNTPKTIGLHINMLKEISPDALIKT